MSDNDALVAANLDYAREAGEHAEEMEKLQAELQAWKHYASFIANAAPAGVPSFAEWKAKQEGGA